jgi:type III secretory pathway component EscV
MDKKTLDQVLPENKKKFLIISNYAIAITAALDLMHLTNIYIFPLQYFALFNLIVLGVAMMNYRIKRDINEKLKAMRELDASNDEEP